LKARIPASTHKKVVVVMLDRSKIRGYLNPSRLGEGETLDLLTPDGEHRTFPVAGVRSIYFIQDFSVEFEPERKVFLSRPKLEGLWVRLKFRDAESIEGVVPNDLLSLLDHGVQITPPDLHGNTLRIFIPRTALVEMTVLGVVGITRRKPVAAAQPGLFTE
jgi:Family of unknown function (DUF6982)